MDLKDRGLKHCWEREHFKKAFFDLVPFHMARVEGEGYFTWTWMRSKHFTCSSLFHCTPEGLKASSSLFLFKWQQHTWVDTHTHICSTDTHRHTLPPAVFTVSWVEKKPTAKKPMVAFLVFLPPPPLLFSRSVSFSRPSGGKTHHFFPASKWSQKVIRIKPTWF